MSVTSFIDELAAALRATACTTARGGRIGLDEGVERAFGVLRRAKEDDRAVLAVGNGGSQVIAQHVEMDLCNRAAMRARSFSSTPVLTALCNDHSHAEAYALLVRSQGREHDVLIAVSSSGASPNIVAAAKEARSIGMPILTFSGFDGDNRLRRCGDLNFWVDSGSYSIVELAHEALVHHLSDRCVELEERSAAAGEEPEIRVVAREPAAVGRNGHH